MSISKTSFFAYKYFKSLPLSHEAFSVYQN